MSSQRLVNHPVKPAIVHAADYAAPYGGNFMASLAALAAQCQQGGFRMVTALPEEARGKPWCAALAEGGQKLHFLPDRASTFQYARKLAEIASAEGAVILHTHFTKYDVAAWLAKRMPRLRRQALQIVWHAHSDVPTAGLRRRLKSFIKYHRIGSAVRIIAVAEAVAESLRAAGVSPAALRVVSNGIDLKRATAASRPRAEVLSSLGLEDGRQLLLLFGYEPLIKGVDLAFDMAGTLTAEGYKIALGIVGTEKLRRYAEMRVAERPLPWLRLLAPQENVADLYQAAAVFLSPSRSEGLPYSVCEAMANGLPVVLSDIPTLAFARRSSGAVFSLAGDSRSLAEAVRAVLHWMPDERRQCGQANQDLVRNEFDLQVWARRVFEVYQEVLQGKD